MPVAKSRKQGIEKAPTGIPGFDDITGGGLPRNRSTLILGSPGAGKTIFALETLVNGARLQGDSGIFIAFEETAKQIMENASTFGWDLAELEREKLFFLDAQLPSTIVTSGDFDLTGILAGLTEKAGQMCCKRIVFDGLDVLLNLLNDPIKERREVYRLHEWLHESNTTGIITAKADGDRIASEKYAFMQFMVDCVVSMNHRLVDRVSLRGLRVLKYRGSSFSENEFPLIISPSGLEVATFGTREMEHEVSMERISTGITRLDTMLDGGYYVRGGERNRALTIVKSRGTKHSNQVRELILSDEGITLTDVFSAGGEVLMGTARWEKEDEVRDAELQRMAQSERARREMELAEADVAARIAALQRELEARRVELKLTGARDLTREQGQGTSQDTIARLRGGMGDTATDQARATGPASPNTIG